MEATITVSPQTYGSRPVKRRSRMRRALAALAACTLVPAAQAGIDVAAWECTQDETTELPYQLAVQAMAACFRTGYLTLDGETYGLYNTSSARLNFIARWRFSANGQVSSWQPVTAEGDIYQMPAALFTLSTGGNRRFYVGVDVEVRFIKATDLALTVPTNAPLIQPVYVRPYQEASNGDYDDGFSLYRMVNMPPGTVQINAGRTCATPGESIELLPAQVGDFHGVGSTAGTVSFDLLLRYCPGEMSSIDYSFGIATSVLDAANGVVALASQPASASGIGIQVLHRDMPVEFDRVYPISDYDPSTSGSYVVPMKALMHQTEPSVTPGAVHSFIYITMNYR